MTIQCCRCKRLQVNGRWTQLTDVSTDHVAHGFCPACIREIDAEHALQSKNSGACRLCPHEESVHLKHSPAQILGARK